MLRDFTIFSFALSATKELSAVSQKFKEVDFNLDEPLEFIVTVNRPGKARLDPHRKIAAEDYRAMVEKITLKGQVELAFPEGIRGLKVVYDKRLGPGKYLAEVSFKQGNRMLISQSPLFWVE